MTMIKHIFLDVDGTLTDGLVYIGNDGELCKGFYVRDGLGIQIAIKEGITPIIFTSRKSEIVVQRCKELGITEIYQGIKNKSIELQEYVKRNHLKTREIAYIADDINDLDSMMYIKNGKGLLGCPSDAVKKIVSISNFVSEFKGGMGAVRDFIEWLLEQEQEAK